MIVRLRDDDMLVMAKRAIINDSRSRAVVLDHVFELEFSLDA